MAYFRLGLLFRPDDLSSTWPIISPICFGLTKFPNWTIWSKVYYHSSKVSSAMAAYLAIFIISNHSWPVKFCLMDSTYSMNDFWRSWYIGDSLFSNETLKEPAKKFITSGFYCLLRLAKESISDFSASSMMLISMSLSMLTQAILIVCRNYEKAVKSPDKRDPRGVWPGSWRSFMFFLSSRV